MLTATFGKVKLPELLRASYDNKNFLCFLLVNVARLCIVYIS